MRRRFISNNGRSAKKILVPCSNSVGWCESKTCQDRFVREHEEDEKHSSSPRRVSVTSSNVLPNDWDEYFSQRGFEDETNQFKRFLSESLTYSMTAALHVQNIHHHETIRIDVVGARAESYSPPWVWRELFAATKESSDVVIRFIGPQIPRTGVVEENNLRLEYIQSTYHEEDSETPDIVFLFNPGFSFSSESSIRDTWIPSVRKIKSLDAHIVSSAYDLKDLSDDITALMREGIHVTEPELNPFGGLRLWKNPTHTTPDAVQFARTNWATYSWIK